MENNLLKRDLVTGSSCSFLVVENLADILISNTIAKTLVKTEVEASRRNERRSQAKKTLHSLRLS